MSLTSREAFECNNNSCTSGSRLPRLLTASVCFKGRTASRAPFSGLQRVVSAITLETKTSAMGISRGCSHTETFVSVVSVISSLRLAR